MALCIGCRISSDWRKQLLIFILSGVARDASRVRGDTIERAVVVPQRPDADVVVFVNITFHIRIGVIDERLPPTISGR